MPAHYPVYLNLTGKKCLVFGGGPIAEDKIAKLQSTGAQVTIVSPTVTPNLQAWAHRGDFQWQPREYQAGDMEGAFLSIAATNDRQVNHEIFQEAERLGVLINVVDDPEQCTFIAPAVVRRGQVTLAISTGGASPALARKLREALTEDPVLEWADLAGVLSLARKVVKKRGLTVDPQRWQCCITTELLQLAQSGHEDQALSSLLSRLTDPDAPGLCLNLESCSAKRCRGRSEVLSGIPSGVSTMEQA
ncbi:MAG TPA: bifunctional precorrin-2 dehydrogenase/sirohydrochlorin ferrochelatase [Dehalococcoidia bacterium]|nr:bifunctional precorrin-2 dehydrogenase/sirohydrochlorin ferrochelatase [Dehalococcoidia bacterium]